MLCSYLQVWGVPLKMSRDGCLKSRSLITNDEKRGNPNLNGEHDQDVSDDSDQTQRPGHQDDEHNLHGRVRTRGEEAGVALAAGVGGLE